MGTVCRVDKIKESNASRANHALLSTLKLTLFILDCNGTLSDGVVLSRNLVTERWDIKVSQVARETARNEIVKGLQKKMGDTELLGEAINCRH